MCELATAFWAEKPKARKQHRCCECRGLIDIGESYHRFRGIWDRPETYKVCLECEALRSEVNADIHAEDASGFTMLYEDVFESHEPDFIKRYLEIAKKRNGRIEPWMWDRLNSAEVA